jgi:hypothetical protein
MKTGYFWFADHNRTIAIPRRKRFFRCIRDRRRKAAYRHAILVSAAAGQPSQRANRIT